MHYKLKKNMKHSLITILESNRWVSFPVEKLDTPSSRNAKQNVDNIIKLAVEEKEKARKVRNLQRMAHHRTNMSKEDKDKENEQRRRKRTQMSQEDKDKEDEQRRRKRTQ